MYRAVSASDSARRPLICFWVSDTVLLFENHNSSAMTLMNFIERSGFFFRIVTKRFFSKIHIAESSIAIADTDHGISENNVLYPINPCWRTILSICILPPTPSLKTFTLPEARQINPRGFSPSLNKNCPF